MHYVIFLVLGLHLVACDTPPARPPLDDQHVRDSPDMSVRADMTVQDQTLDPHGDHEVDDAHMTDMGERLDASMRLDEGDPEEDASRDLGGDEHDFGISSDMDMEFPSEDRGIGPVCPECPEGYEEGIACRCIDLDECDQAAERGVVLCEESPCVNHDGGYHCYLDEDADGVDDWFDNCLNLANPDQDDLDRDQIGDLCDDDQDGDLSTQELDCDDRDPNLGARFFDTECDGALDNTRGQPSFSVGWRHTCGILEDGSLRCWGGSPLITEQVSGIFPALEVPTGKGGETLYDWVSVSAGHTYTCGIRRGGRLLCWGSDRHGQATQPVREDGTPHQDWLKVTTGGASGSFTCGLHATGEVECWGFDDRGQTTPPLVDPTTPTGRWIDLHAGYQHTCGRFESGGIQCWGSDQFGQVSAPSEVDLEQLAQDGVQGLTPPWLTVGAGYAHSCGLRAGGGISCWGLNTEDQASPPNWDEFGQPHRWSALSVGGFHGCGIYGRGELLCWGIFDQFSGHYGLFYICGGTLGTARPCESQPDV